MSRDWPCTNRKAPMADRSTHTGQAAMRTRSDKSVVPRATVPLAAVHFLNQASCVSAVAKNRA
jgi:hypothetical protein